MAEPEFSATGVEIGKWLRPLTRAGQVLISDGRLRLLTSRGAEIDSAPVDRVDAGAAWSAPGTAKATMNGKRYRIDLTAGRSFWRGVSEESGQRAVRRFLDALQHARRG